MQILSCSELKAWDLADVYYHDECFDFVSKTTFEFVAATSLI